MENRRKWVARWLLAGVLMIIIQTLLGGVTRLTGSGLSITKWDPLFGIIPPHNDRQWNQAFEGYKRIGQFRYLNSGFTLDDFRSIFFWEWLHRVWARMLGVVFGIGFVFFLVKRYFDKQMIRPMLALFALGGLQGLLGWRMVASGIDPENIYVGYMWLAAHFIAAMILACYTLWFAMQLLITDRQRIAGRGISRFALLIIVAVFVQLMYGAFMAGLKAAMAAPTWPDINTMYLPGTLFTNNLVADNNIAALKINVHFMHRNLAYLVLCMVACWSILAARSNTAGSILKKTLWWPLLLVGLQVALGIATVLNAPHIVPGKFGVFEILAEMHQLVAMFLLMSLVVNFYIVSKPGDAPAENL